jgi:iron-sulfur cluster repair protein YtfE (RIC family)
MSSPTLPPVPPATPAAEVPQLRLPGQAAAHPGPVDMSMMYLMHHAFRRDLAAFAAAAPVTPPEDREAWVALAERWEIFSFTLHHHHHGEDMWLWPFLMERADPAQRDLLRAMEAEHEEIDPTLAACAAGFDRLRRHADEDARAALAVRLTAARESLGRHLHHEETETIAMIQSGMTNDEWHAVDEHFKSGLALRQLVRIVPWVMHQVPAEVQEQVFAQAGAAHRLLWLATRRGFARRHAVAFRHLAG